MLSLNKEAKAKIFWILLVCIAIFVIGALASNEINIQSVSKTFSENTLYNVELVPGLKSLKIDGSYTLGTRAEVYLLGDFGKYMIFDSSFYEFNKSSEINSVFVPGDKINIKLNYGPRSSKQPIDSFIDFNLYGSSFNFDVNYDKLCSKWQINENAYCAGSSECCLFLGLDPYLSSWNSTFGLTYDMAGKLDNNISISLNYVDFDLSSETPYADIFSNTASIDASFYDKIEFNDSCVDSCSFPMLALQNYTLQIIIDSGSLTIDGINYEANSRFISFSSNTNSTLYVYDDGEDNVGLYVFHNYSIFASYNDTITNSSILNATCNATFSDGEVIGMIYNYYLYRGTKYFNRTGFYNYTVSCVGENYSTLTQQDNITIGTFDFSLTDSGNTFTGAEDASVVFADYNNDDWWDLVVAGDSAASGTNDLTTFYDNKGNGSFVQNGSYSVSGSETGSISFGDINRDGFLDMGITGYDGSKPIANLYLNNGSAFNNNQNLTQVRYSSIKLQDIDLDGDLDVGSCGANGTNIYTNVYIFSNNIYINNTNLYGLKYCSISFLNIFNSNNPHELVMGGNSGDIGNSLIYNYSFQNINNLTGLLRSSQAIGDIDNDGDLDLVIGGGATLATTNSQTLVYINNGTNLNLAQNLTRSGSYWGSLAIGDLNNDGFMDLVVTGQNSSGTSITNVYINNGTLFNYNGTKSINGIYKSSIALFDYDNDGGLDLAIAGNNGAKVAYLYDNNINTITNNSAPSPPSTFSTNFDGTWLNLSWGNGSDDITPTLGLYYNIRIGTKPYGNDIVSGKYGGSSNPTQGYIGNMQQRKSVLINTSLNQTYFWQVQTIDNSLKPGNWSSVQEYNPCSVPSSDDWNISVNCVKYNQIIVIAQDKDVNIKNGVSLTLINSTLLFNQTANGNSGLYLINGSLNISQTNISSVNSYGYNILVYNNTNFSMSKSYLSKAGYADNYNQRGLEINGSIIAFSNNIFSDNYVGISFYSSNSLIQDSTFRSSNYDIYSLNTNNNTLVNITFTNSNINNGYINVKWYLDVNVTAANASNSALSGVNVTVSNSTDNATVDSKITDSLGAARFSLLQYVNLNNSLSYNPNYSLSFHKNVFFNDESRSVNLTSNTILSVGLTNSTYPIWSEFYNNLTTNFSLANVSLLNNLSNVTIGKNNIALINFTEPVNVASLDLDAAVELSYNSVYVSSSATGINKPAIISLYNLSYVLQPLVLKDGVLCATCTILSYSSNTLRFNVTGFSTYTSAANSYLSSSYSNRINNKPLFNQTVYFTANYSNRTSSVSMNGATEGCNISFGSGYLNMTYNSSTNLYQYNRTFNSAGSYPYNISCFNNVGFENMSLSSTATIYHNYTLLSLNQSLTGLEYSSLVIGDISGDGLVDLVSVGHISSSNYSIYYNNNSNFVYNSSEVINAFQDGSLALVDYNKDSYYEIVEIGLKDTNAINNFYRIR